MIGKDIGQVFLYFSFAIESAAIKTYKVTVTLKKIRHACCTFYSIVLESHDKVQVFCACRHQMQHDFPCNPDLRVIKKDCASSSPSYFWIWSIAGVS